MRAAERLTLSNRFEQAAALGLGYGELFFEPITQGHQFIHLSDDAKLFGNRALAGFMGSTGVRLRSEQPEVTESLFNRHDLIGWARIVLRCVPWYGEAKLLFAACNPSALGHKAVLARNPFLDFLVRSARTQRDLCLPG